MRQAGVSHPACKVFLNNRDQRIDMRGISRLGVTHFDTEAVVRREIFIPAV